MNADELATLYPRDSYVQPDGYNVDPERVVGIDCTPEGDLFIVTVNEHGEYSAWEPGEVTKHVPCPIERFERLHSYPESNGGSLWSNALYVTRAHGDVEITLHPEGFTPAPGVPYGVYTWQAVTA